MYYLQELADVSIAALDAMPVSRVITGVTYLLLCNGWHSGVVGFNSSIRAYKSPQSASR